MVTTMIRANSSAPAVVDLQPLYETVRDWALRGMGYGLGDHPSTSGERGVLEVLAQRTASGGIEGHRKHVIFDVGANVGDYSRLAAEVVPSAYLYCFEPSHRAFASLCGSTVTAGRWWYPYGLSDATRSAPLHTDTLGSGMASVHPRRLTHFGRVLDVEERATFRRLDDVCREIGVPRIDLLKIDVEGHELAVLHGAGEMLTSGAIGMVQWEMGGCNLDSRTTWQDFWYLLSGRYDLYRVVADGLVAVPAYREQDEVYICANFVAVWRGP